MEDDLEKKEKKGRRQKNKKMEDEPINQNYLIGCDTIENSPSFVVVVGLFYYLVMVVCLVNQPILLQRNIFWNKIQIREYKSSFL